MRRTGVRIDMTPMVDVAFLLLIFFMSTTQFKPPEEVAVQLPLSSSEIRIPETDTIIITVDRTGSVFFSSEAAVDLQRIDREDLFAAITAWRGRNPNAVVIVKGDRNAAFGTIADLMDALVDSKTLRFNLMTDPKSPRRAEDAPAGERS